MQHHASFGGPSSDYRQGDTEAGSARAERGWSESHAGVGGTIVELRTSSELNRPHEIGRNHGTGPAHAERDFFPASVLERVSRPVDSQRGTACGRPTRATWSGVDFCGLWNQLLS